MPTTTPADLFAGQYPQLVHQLKRRLRLRHEDAEDAATFAFEQYLRKAPSEEETIGGWLYVVAMREAFRQGRKCGRELPIWDESRLIAESAASAAERRLEAMGALEAVARLRPHQRTAVALQASGHSYSEIAEVTGRTYTWVNRHVTAGNAALREERTA